MNYELVTGEGQILQVNSKSNKDLFWALKGGSGNFGFVTNFDFAVYPLIEIYAGNFITDATAVEHLIQASASYADPVHGGVSDPLSAVNPTVQLALDTGERSSFTSIFYNATTNSPPPAVKNFTIVPTSAASTVAGPRSFIGYLNETAVFLNDLR